MTNLHQTTFFIIKNPILIHLQQIFSDLYYLSYYKFSCLALNQSPIYAQRGLLEYKSRLHLLEPQGWRTSRVANKALRKI